MTYKSVQHITIQVINPYYEKMSIYCSRTTHIFLEIKSADSRKARKNLNSGV